MQRAILAGRKRKCDRSFDVELCSIKNWEIPEVVLTDKEKDFGATENDALGPSRTESICYPQKFPL